MISNLNKLICFVFCLNSLSAQIQNHVNITEYDVEFETINNRLNGEFKAYATSSGKKTLFIDGKLQNGQRIGVWTVYDTLNPQEILIQRNYSDPHHFQQVVPNLQKHKLISFINQNINKIPELDTIGCRSYVYVTQNDFIYGKRLFREIQISENPHLPFDQINALLKEKSTLREFTKYRNETFSEVLEGNPYDSLNSEIVAYRIKEDFFFDKNQLISEYRILGFAPVYKDPRSGELRELCWYYYPYLRRFFKDIKLDEGINQNNLDIAFLDRNFSGSIYKTMEFSRFENMIESDHFQTDIQCLMVEHQIWLFFAGFNDNVIW